MFKRRVHFCSAKDCASNYSDDSETRRFRFPKDEVRCKLWVERCRNKDLLTINADALYASRRLCGKHFAPHAFVNALNQRLVHDAVPSIFHFNMEESEHEKEPLEWQPSKTPHIIKKRVKEPSLSPPLARKLLQLSTDPGESPLSTRPHILQRVVLEPLSLTNSMLEPSVTPPQGKRPVELRSVSPESVPTVLTSRYPEQDTPNLMDLEPNIWAKHMELFEQSEGREFLIVGEVCMIAEKDPDQMCGSVKCNDDLYSNSRSEKLVRCWSRCKKWFHLRCTDLTMEEYNILSRKESLRWLCEECCKDDIF